MFITEVRDHNSVVPRKPRSCSRRNLVIGSFIFFVLLIATLGSALGVTLGQNAKQHSEVVSLRSSMYFIPPSSYPSTGTPTKCANTSLGTVTTSTQTTSTASITCTMSTASPSSGSPVVQSVNYTVCFTPVFQLLCIYVKRSGSRYKMPRQKP